MKTKITTQYVCECCGDVYLTEDAARTCEKKPISKGKGVSVGDIVLVTGGEGAGERAKVTSVSVAGRSFGHYQWERYWHTIVLNADLVDSFGSRVLTFDQYETLT